MPHPTFTAPSSEAATRPWLGAWPAPLRGAVAGGLLGLNTLWWCALLFVLALVRLLPWHAARRLLDPWLNRVATAWIAGNSVWMRLTQRTVWDVQGLDRLAMRGWYLVVANHQSWVDIFVLQHLLNRRIPMLKFFLKRELIWVPVMGLAWWALDFPFMRRHADAVLVKHPEKRLEDIEATRRACARFALVPTSVMNFVEGTRFTPTKRAVQRSHYRHLLRPKAGGLAMAMNALGDRFDALLDLTIVYPDGPPTFWQFLRGDVRRVVVRAEHRPIPADVARGDYAGDPRYRKRVQRWLLALWRDKDALIDTLKGVPAAAVVPDGAGVARSCEAASARVPGAPRWRQPPLQSPPSPQPRPAGVRGCAAGAHAADAHLPALGARLEVLPGELPGARALELDVGSILSPGARDSRELWRDLSRAADPKVSP